MLTALLLSALLAAPPTALPQTTIEISSIQNVFAGDFLPLGEPDGQREIFILFRSGDILLMPMDHVALEGDNLVFQELDRGEENENVELVHTWKHQGSTITVRTDCARYTMSKCVKVHANAVQLMQEAFPETIEH